MSIKVTQAWDGVELSLEQGSGSCHQSLKDKRLAAPLPDSPFTRGELGALLPPGNEKLRDYVNTFIAKQRKKGRLKELEARYLHNSSPETQSR